MVGREKNFTCSRSLLVMRSSGSGVKIMMVGREKFNLHMAVVSKVNEVGKGVRF